MSDIRSLKGKTGAILVALIFMVCFGGVGAFTGWVVGGTLWAAWEASGWTKVPAEVLEYDGASSVRYRYEFNDRMFLGQRMGVAVIDSDDGHPEAARRIQQAMNDKTPLEILVDPDDPSRSVVDTAINWTMMVGFLPFALGFGAVGLGALGVVVSLMIPKRAGDDEEDEAISSDAASGFIGLAAFTFLWNALAFPIGAVVVMEAMRNGEWMMFFVLIFPLIGLLLIWGTINSGITWIRRGGAKLHPQHLPPRLGAGFSGHVSFARGVEAGDAFRAQLACTSSGSRNQGTITHWKGERQVRVTDVGGNRRASFRFDPPDRIEGFERDAVTQWQLDLFPEGKQAAAFSFPFKMQPPAGVEHLPEEELDEPHAAEVLDDEEPVPVAAAPGAALNLILGKGTLEQRMDKLPPAQREQLAKRLAGMTPEQRKSLEKAAAYGPMVKKLVIAAIVLFFLVQMVGVVSMLFFSN